METDSHVGRDLTLGSGFLLVGVVTPLAALFGTALAESETAVWLDFLLVAMMPFLLGLALLSGALRRSANVRLTLGALLGVLALLGAYRSFSLVGPLAYFFSAVVMFTRHDAFLTLIPATIVPAALGAGFIVSGARKCRAQRAGAAR